MYVKQMYSNSNEAFYKKALLANNALKDLDDHLDDLLDLLEVFLHHLYIFLLLDDLQLVAESLEPRFRRHLDVNVVVVNGGIVVVVAVVVALLEELLQLANILPRESVEVRAGTSLSLPPWPCSTYA